MKINFLTSAFNEGFTDEFIEKVKPHTHGGRFVFIASDFNAHKKTVNYCGIFLKFFEEKGMTFPEAVVVDHAISKTRARKEISEADIVWICGGDTVKEMEYLNEYDIGAALREFDGAVIGMSAGSINMAHRVVLAKDIHDNIPELSVYEGLGLVDINVEPHTNQATEEHWQEIFEASYKAPIYCLYDDSFIVEQDGKSEIFGRCDIAENGKVIN